MNVTWIYGCCELLVFFRVTGLWFLSYTFSLRVFGGWLIFTEVGVLHFLCGFSKGVDHVCRYLFCRRYVCYYLQIKINSSIFFIYWLRKVKKILNHQKRRCRVKEMGIRINDFPGGSDGFDLVSRLLQQWQNINYSSYTLLCHFSWNDWASFQQTQSFLEGIHNWIWNYEATTHHSHSVSLCRTPIRIRHVYDTYQARFWSVQ